MALCSSACRWRLLSSLSFQECKLSMPLSPSTVGSLLWPPSPSGLFGGAVGQGTPRQEARFFTLVSASDHLCKTVPCLVYRWRQTPRGGKALCIPQDKAGQNLLERFKRIFWYHLKVYKFREMYLEVDFPTIFIIFNCTYTFSYYLKQCIPLEVRLLYPHISRISSIPICLCASLLFS